MHGWIRTGVATVVLGAAVAVIAPAQAEPGHRAPAVAPMSFAGPAPLPAAAAFRPAYPPRLAPAGGSIRRVADAGKPGLWDQTKHNAAKAWHKTKHGAKRAWQGAKDLGADVYHNAKKTVSKGVDTVEKKTDGNKDK